MTSSTVAVVVKCFMVLLSLGFLQDYTIDFQKVRIAQNFKFDKFKFTYIQLNTVSLPSSVSLAYNDTTIVVHLPDCASLSAQVGVSLFGLVTIPTAAQLDLCGDAVWSRAGGPDACHATSFVPNATLCTLTARLSIYGQDPIVFNVCDAVGELATGATVDSVPPVFPLSADPSTTTPTSAVTLFHALHELVASLGTVGGVAAEVSFPDPTAVHMRLTANRTLRLIVPGLPVRDVSPLTSAISTADYVTLVEALFNATLGAEMAGQLRADVLVDKFTLRNGPLGFLLNASLSIPAGASVEWDVLFTNLTCTSTAPRHGTALDCGFPSAGGLAVGNWHVTGLADLDPLLQGAGHALTAAITQQLPALLTPWCAEGPDGGWCHFLSTAAPAVAYPSLAPNATSVKAVQLFALAGPALNAILNAAGVSVEVSALTDTTERLSFLTTRAISLAPLATLLQALVGWGAQYVQTAAPFVPVPPALYEDGLRLVSQVCARVDVRLGDWAAQAPVLPEAVRVQLDVAFPSMRCGTALGLDCTFPAVGGIVPVQLSLDNVSDWEFVVPKYFPALSANLMPWIDAVLVGVCDANVAAEPAEDVRCSVAGLWGHVGTLLGA